MCIAYPGRIIEVVDGTAVVETEGRRRRASLMLVPEAVAGDWVVVATGTVLNVLDPEEAKEIIRMLDDAALADAAAHPDPARPDAQRVRADA